MDEIIPCFCRSPGDFPPVRMFKGIFRVRNKQEFSHWNEDARFSVSLQRKHDPVTSGSWTRIVPLKEGFLRKLFPRKAEIVRDGSCCSKTPKPYTLDASGSTSASVIGQTEPLPRYQKCRFPKSQSKIWLSFPSNDWTLLRAKPSCLLGNLHAVLQPCINSKLSVWNWTGSVPLSVVLIFNLTKKEENTNQ